MILRLFGFGGRGRAKHLVRLANQTIAMMQNMLSEMSDDDPNRRIIEAHLVRRVQQLDRYSMLARGETDMSEQIAPTMSGYDIWKGSMENEIGEFGSSTDRFVWYLKQIKQR